MQISKKSFILWLTSFCLTIAFTTYHSHSSPVSDPKIGAPRERLIYRLGYADFGAIGL